MAQNNWNWFVGPYQDLSEKQQVFLDPDHIVPEKRFGPPGQPKPPNNFDDEGPPELDGDANGPKQAVPPPIEEKVLSSVQSRNPYRNLKGRVKGNVGGEGKIQRPAVLAVYSVVVTVVLVAALVRSCRVNKKGVRVDSDDGLGSYSAIH